ncbi:Autophagy protein 7 [Coemansia sp. RSA 1813]|nr:Autophagy protein 7 [Coemansia sp. RSA 1646]KAJ1772842.1 Autophagy protein 7 [Coemansia sp. RSA 1843]KAJ2088893.1 Autophagy protein 7 [Coemansia sp. RSA 986]KAJ2213955.1 Autophagy protein 7 [Coemansia sp. RSA 487]KAJ2568737.1 Autophagy protein 7 [Coemansia sp. RSA 1813]
MSEILRFEPFASTIEPEFWSGLAQHKLHSARLDTTRTLVCGEFAGGRRHALRNAAAPEAAQKLAVPARLRVSQDAWNKAEVDQTSKSGGDSQKQAGVAVEVDGFLHNTNTIEEFKKCDKGEILREAGAGILDAIRSGRASKAPELLWPFTLLSFADLKKYHFYHWVSFPAVTADPPDTTTGAAVPIPDFVSNDSDLAALHTAFAAFVKGRPQSYGAFAAVYQPRNTSSPWSIYSLEDWDSAFGEGSGADSTAMLGFIDPSSHSTRPGWPLRNLLTWMRYIHPETAKLKVLCFRDAALSSSGSETLRQQSESIVINVQITPAAELKAENQVSGWERNEKQKLAPRVVNLSSTMNPVQLAESALDLNLQLMRWRLAPSIDLTKMAGMRALLIGAGTLGAYTARALLAWGVRKITFVDNGRVSFSNPARQPLYDFADSLDGGKPKAVAAAESMRRIFPNIDSQGVQLSIPMPGHSVSPAELDATQSAAKRLEDLVVDHDVVFLLTDSRESRWLPTMLGALHRKIVICVALGFDSFVAMRHGVYPNNCEFEDSSAQDKRLGCYFCNDVVAPTDSLTDRTLDQQCTVSRPGLAPIASGMAVELFATVVQHPLGGHAPGPLDSAGSDTSSDGVFGVPEHQIRGFLSGFRQHAIVGRAYDMCPACSPSIINSYRKYGFEFLLRAFNNVLVSENAPHIPVDIEEGAANVPAGYSYLETLTGLAAMHRQTDAMIDDIEWSGDEEDGLNGSGDDDFEAL